jgi:hypothetical protein
MSSLLSLSLSNLTFLNPWVLSGFAALPIIWFILKVMPPAPKRINFPATHFLSGLVPEDIKSEDTPLWLRLLRLLIVALIIIAFAHPVSKPEDTTSWRGAMRLVIDNSWAAAPTWSQQIQKAEELLKLAEREKSQIFILETAARDGQKAPTQIGPISAIKAQQYMKAAEPVPWPANYGAMRSSIEDTKREGQSQLYITSFWLSHGIAEGAIRPVISALKNQGDLNFYKPKDDSFIPYIKDYKYIFDGNKFSVEMGVAGKAPQTTPITLRTLNQTGTVLDKQTISLGQTEKSRMVEINLPPELRNQISAFELEGQNHAASLYLLDDNNRKRRVGLVTFKAEDDATPLIEAEYYIARALAPYADIIRGELQTVIAEKPSVIILPDIGGLPLDDLNTLSEWVDDGGVLIRFAGPNMARSAAEQNDTLVPVPLSRTDRALDGALTWSTPLPLAPFPETSPFYGIELSDTLTVKRQLLAASGEGLTDKTWASLNDGTPLVTAKSKNDGLLILVHTTATPEWSDLALSGTFVKMLQKMLSLSGKSNFQITVNQQLFPITLINAFGQRQPPKGTEKPILAKDLAETVPSALTPPGLYGNGNEQTALHLGHHLSRMTKRELSLPGSVNILPYNNQASEDYKAAFLTLAALFFFVDWFIMFILQIISAPLFTSRSKNAAAKAAKATSFFVVLSLGILSFSGKTHAQISEPLTDHMRYASDVSIGFVSAGSPALDSLTRKGLKTLEQAVEQRTSVSIGTIKQINPETDDLAFYTLIYWPISPQSKTLNPDGQRNVQYYLDHGGTILFDTRDQLSAVKTGVQANLGRNGQYLRQITSPLNIPPLHPIPRGHVLSKTFYLLQGYPGKYQNGTVWIEKQSNIGRDGVSSVLVGAHDWAGAWAAVDDSGFRVYGSDRQSEMSLRFGVNLIMYALTGNYKDDQVHIPHILERLGQ